MVVLLADGSDDVPPAYRPLILGSLFMWIVVIVALTALSGTARVALLGVALVVLTASCGWSLRLSRKDPEV